MIIGIVGVGVMGADIAIDVAARGHEVVLFDNDECAIERFKDSMRSKVRGYKLSEAAFSSITLKDVSSLVRVASTHKELSNVDWIIESVTENYETKKAVYASLASVLPENVLYAINTSCIPITKLSSLLKIPGKAVGIHFMNPVSMIHTVEVIRGFHTTEETLNSANEMLSSIGKKSIVVNDMAGFVANRLSHLFMNEAAFLVQDGVASAKQIDAIFRDCYGHKMGPLETADLIGLDTVMNSLDVLYQHYQDPKFRCSPVLRQMVDAGVHGKKTGQGFYGYDY